MLCLNTEIFWTLLSLLFTVAAFINSCNVYSCLPLQCNSASEILPGCCSDHVIHHSLQQESSFLVSYMHGTRPPFVMCSHPACHQLIASAEMQWSTSSEPFITEWLRLDRSSGGILSKMTAFKP